MIERTFDATIFNQIVNDPAVRPFVADMKEGTLDLSDKIADHCNVCLIGEHGAFLCLKYYDGCYEVHTQVLPVGRGAWAKSFAEEGARYMFTSTECTEIVTRVPEKHLGALRLSYSMGFRTVMTTPPECSWREELQRCHILSLTIQEWASRPLPEMVNRGRLFHDWLHENVQNGGEPHLNDDEHNKVVGTCLSMIDADQPVKAVVWYNRSAYAFRHPPIELLSMEPLRIKFDAGVLWRDGEGRVQLESSGSAHP